MRKIMAPAGVARTTFKKRLFLALPWRLWGGIWRLNGGEFMAARQFRKNNTGRNCYVDPTVQIFGYRNVTMGDYSTISEDTLLNVNRRGDVTDRIIIGSNCHIGRRNYFSTGQLIHIKDYSFTGLDCHFLGCGHDIHSPRAPYISTGLSNGAAIEVGVNCWLTTSVTVLEGVQIGHGSVIGARSVVTHDIPPFSIALGARCDVVKRFDFKNNEWCAMREWKDAYEAYIPSENDYLADLRQANPSVPGSLHASSRLFGWLA